MTNGKSLSSGAAEMWGEYDREELVRYVEAITGSYVDADDFYFTCAC
jgi:hypothetical protein